MQYKCKLTTKEYDKITGGFYNSGKVQMIYWKETTYGEEVDFIIEDSGKITAVEIKLNSRVNKLMAKSLFSFVILFLTKYKRYS